MNTKIKPINGWTKHEMIARLREKLPPTGRCMEGGEVNILEDEYCHYRHEGFTCAIGAFIPDDVYSQAMEGMGVGSLLSQYSDLKRALPFAKTGELSCLQLAHDSAADNAVDDVVAWVEENVED